MNDEAILKELLQLSRESAANDAEIKSEVKNLQIRLDKQDTILEALTNTVTKQQEMNKDVAALTKRLNATEKVILELDKRIEVLEKAPTEKTLQAVKSAKGGIKKAIGVVITAILSAATGVLISFIFH